MMNAFFIFLLSQFVLIPVFIGFVRFKRMDKIYYPFFVLLIVGFVNEVISFILIRGFKTTNAPANNIYSLVECCLIVYQLYLWKNSKKGFRGFMILIGICIVLWITQNILFFKLKSFDYPYFMVFYAFIIVLLSIHHINTIMMRPKVTSLLKNPQIIICVAFIAFFTYQIIYVASRFISKESTIHIKLTFGFSFINLATNALFAIAIYFITSKSEKKYDEYFRNR